MDIPKLITAALAAREQAYAPYSRFYVGAALLTGEGRVYTGCNIENGAYPAGNCAERTAVFKAVSEGERDFAAIAIVGGPAGSAPQALCPPCGICRQVLSEFCSADFTVILAKSAQDYEVHTLGELLPLAFSLD